MTPTPTLASLAPALPEIWLTVAACIVLLTDAFAGRASRLITPTLTLLLIALGAAAILVWGQVPQRTDLFSGMYVADPLATVLKLLSFLFTAVALLYSRHWLESRGLLKGEYYVLVLTALLGICVIVSAGSLLTLYIGVELLALSLYALVAFDRDSGVAAESAMKYFVLGAIASGCLLYGMSLVYGMTGSLLLSEIAAAVQGQGVSPSNSVRCRSTCGCLTSITARRRPRRCSSRRRPRSPPSRSPTDCWRTVSRGSSPLGAR
jgi:NADH-quinone oxidoreductase subunit N